MVAATDDQVARLGGADAGAIESTSIDESTNGGELEIGEGDGTIDNDGDIEPMDPADVADATCNSEVRGILAAANQAMADQLKAQTDKLLGAVLYTTSMKMSNGFNRSDN
jgi:dipeptidase